MKFSILISTYREENPKYLKECLDSMFNQTLKSDDIVLVCDGGLTLEMYSIIMEFKQKYEELFRIIFLEENQGAAKAANIGIKACRNEIIIKMDSDDISSPFRCEKQIKAFDQNPDLGICGGFIREINCETKEEISVKRVPVNHEDIIKYSKRRNPINHPTIAFRKSLIEKYGGYNDIKRCEDYDFICRMLMNGVKAENIPEILLDYRINKENYNRRKNWKNTKSFLKVRWANFKNGYCGLIDFLIPGTAQLAMFVLPVRFTEILYKIILRK